MRRPAQARPLLDEALREAAARGRATAGRSAIQAPPSTFHSWFSTSQVQNLLGTAVRWRLNICTARGPAADGADGPGQDGDAVTAKLLAQLEEMRAATE
jgi:hypothetical protein